MKRLGLTMVALAVCIATPAMAQRQAASSKGTLRYGVQAGLLMPIGDYGDGDKLGFVGGVGATYWLAGTGNIGIRADASYSQTSHDGIDGNTKMIGGMASLVYALMPPSAPARVMLTAGVGFYNVKIDISGTSGSESKVGFGGGAAVAFKLGTGSTRFVVGTRYQSVSTDPSLNFVPITVGLSFGK